MGAHKKKRDPFDAFLFGNRTRQKGTRSEESPFDWVEFMKNMSDTYNSFNPYIKNLSKTIDDFKNGNNK
ncbi:hypothetical protein GCM10007216_01500 [Thalassobacillus devorans]|uniref:YozE SAM-like domain-containing protein n=1 Tax=Thalassobacillus devorans TaxID=279813 RepID=A0ABQ1NEE7_9BACI|nr:hypothetical protein [Thalassobacillus devorans]NIK27058.1 hypothetical protein [Thalassobacillus devorans]GGC74568.1 hypothetical protein GCM10007216_01500 [Thalassobacillus devorans]